MSKSFLGTPLVPLVLAGVLAACSKAPQAEHKPARDTAIAVTVAAVELAPLDRTIPVMGTLAARNEAVISAQVEGQVEKTLVDFGAQVRMAQELAFIDTANYEVQARQADASLAKARANAANQEAELKRVIQLREHNIAAASQFDLATAQSAQAQAEVKAAEAAKSLADLNLQRSRVKAPFEGSVSERIATAGDYVKIGSPLFRLVDDGELKFVVQAPERYAGQVELGQLVRFSVDAWPGKAFEGKVYLISPSVAVNTRAFNIGVLVPNRDRKLKANSYARGELVLQSRVPTPTVPLDAIVNFAGVSKVFIITEGVARSREVKVGVVKDGRQEILSGLNPGELVAVTGQTKLYESARVRLDKSAPSRTSS